MHADERQRMCQWHSYILAENLFWKIFNQVKATSNYQSDTMTNSKMKSAGHSVLSLCNPMDHRLPGSSVHGILQARLLEWITISFSRVPSWPRDWTWVSCIKGRFFTFWPTQIYSWIKISAMLFVDCLLKADPLMSFNSYIFISKTGKILSTLEGYCDVSVRC